MKKKAKTKTLRMAQKDSVVTAEVKSGKAFRVVLQDESGNVVMAMSSSG